MLKPPGRGPVPEARPGDEDGNKDDPSGPNSEGSFSTLPRPWIRSGMDCDCPTGWLVGLDSAGLMK
ncbi:protein of unknown function [Cyanobium sp. NIES-981]|nr:protein of unknown function [Cyanobium sp. NIES-981]